MNRLYNIISQKTSSVKHFFLSAVQNVLLMLLASVFAVSCATTNVKKIPYTGRGHGSMEHEWLAHRGAPGWWYATGTLKDSAGNLYSYQFTIIRAKKSILYPYVLHLALTDFKNQQHFFSQEFKLGKKGIIVNDSTVQFLNKASVVKRKDGLYLNCQSKDFKLDLLLQYGKNPVWHCDNGYLVMGEPQSKESTIYYSYTNLPTSGKMTLGGKEIKVSGKTWFDRQSGPYDMLARKNHWEWFSLRFDDNEEVMLFSFPQNQHQDGTFIPKDGKYQRLTNYTIKAIDTVTTADGLRFTSGWEITLPQIKSEKYTIVPLMKGQMNVGYYEQLGKIIDKNGKQVGICFVELLPGVLNQKFQQRMTQNMVQKH